MLERTLLRLILIGMATLTILVSVEVWRVDSGATDWEWFYRFALPVSAGWMLTGVRHPRIVGMSRLFVPVLVVSLVRLVDFQQDWWLTPVDPESPGLGTRVRLASYGWGMIALFTALIVVMERLFVRLSAKLYDKRCADCPDATVRVE